MIDFNRLRTGLILAIVAMLVGMAAACGGGGGAPSAPAKSDAPAAKAPAKSDAPAKTDAPGKTDAKAPAGQGDSASVSKVDSPPPGQAASPAAASPVAVTGPQSTAWINQELLPKARQEGQVVWYTAAELSASEAVAKAFQAATGIPVEVVRSGGERLYSRIAQERQARQYLVDVFLTSVEAQFLEYQAEGVLQPYQIMEDAVYGTEFKDPTGLYYTTFLNVSQPAYNPNLVPADQVPKSWKDLLDPKWKGQLSHSHPAYSGTTLAAMLGITQLHGWEYYEQLVQNEPLIVQSAIEPAPLIISGERPVAALMSGSTAVTEKLKGNPIEPIYPEEGVSVARLPSAVFKDAPHPNAARVFQDFLHSQEAQQIWVNDRNYISVRDDVTYPPGLKPLSEIKYFLLDAQVVEAKREEVKDKFKDIFGS